MTNKKNMEDREAIVVGQKVNPVKVERAKEFRRKTTPQERKLWNRLRNNQLNGFHFPNFIILSIGGIGYGGIGYPST